MLGRIRAAVAEFEGVHNFHNYTVGKDFRDRSATRVMKELAVSEPFLVEGTEWVSITFLGQSFMLHQIVGDPNAYLTLQRLIPGYSGKWWPW